MGPDLERRGDGRSEEERLLSQFWRFGVLAFWRFGVLALWRFGALAFWRFGVLALWRFGVLALWRLGNGHPLGRERLRSAGECNDADRGQASSFLLI